MTIENVIATITVLLWVTVLLLVVFELRGRRYGDDEKMRWQRAMPIFGRGTQVSLGIVTPSGVGLALGPTPNS
jgi:hypothetical protein